MEVSRKMIALGVLTERRQRTYNSRQLVPTEGIYIPSTDTTDTTNTERMFEADALLNELSDLVNPQFRAWYCKVFYRLGRQRVYE